MRAVRSSGIGDRGNGLPPHPHAVELGGFVVQRAVAQPTITYRQLIDGLQPEDALPALAG